MLNYCASAWTRNRKHLDKEKKKKIKDEQIIKRKMAGDELGDLQKREYSSN